jgi:hypothetical protein
MFVLSDEQIMIIRSVLCWQRDLKTVEKFSRHLTQPLQQITVSAEKNYSAAC